MSSGLIQSVKYTRGIHYSHRPQILNVTGAALITGAYNIEKRCLSTSSKLLVTEDHFRELIEHARCRGWPATCFQFATNKSSYMVSANLFRSLVAEQDTALGVILIIFTSSLHYNSTCSIHIPEYKIKLWTLSHGSAPRSTTLIYLHYLWDQPIKPKIATGSGNLKKFLGQWPYERHNGESTVNKFSDMV